MLLRLNRNWVISRARVRKGIIMNKTKTRGIYTDRVIRRKCNHRDFDGDIGAGTSMPILIRTVPLRNGQGHRAKVARKEL